jgi:tRNA threonylcarbamoyladenosine biosynthesis protein TsaE
MTENLTTHSEDATVQAGKEFSRRLVSGAIVAFYGELGTGKTRFIKGVCQGLSVQEHVTSPTFTIVNEYRGADFPVYHFDFYRINALSEMQEIGFDEYLGGDGVCLIEWADRIAGLLPPERFDIHLQLGKNDYDREIIIEQRIEKNQ